MDLARMQRSVGVAFVSVLVAWPAAVSATDGPGPGSGSGQVRSAHRATWLDDGCGALTRNVHPATTSRIDRSAVALAKSVERTDHPDGSSTFRVTMTGDLAGAAASADGLDCLWIDRNGNGRRDRDERAKGYFARRVTKHSTDNGTDRITFEVRVRGAVGRTVCDRGFAIEFVRPRADTDGRSEMRTGSGAGPGRPRWRWAFSQTVCTPPLATPPPAEVPEVPVVPMLAVSAAATSAVALGFIARRRRRPSPT